VEPSVEEMIGDHVMKPMTVKMYKYRKIKIVQDEEAGKVKTGKPKRVRDPGIQVVIIRRRYIIGNHRRAFLGVVVIDYRRFNVFAACWRLTLCVLIRFGRNSQTKPCGCILKRLQCFIFSHRNLFSRSRGNHCILQLTHNYGRHGIIGNPSVLRFNADRR
jgi:hypothetical protein